MKRPQIVHTNIEFRVEELARSLVGRRLDSLTAIEMKAFHLCRVMDIIIADFGSEGVDPGVVVEL